MRRTTLDIPRMDCPSEERMIRLALAEVAGITTLTFDIPERQLVVEHEGDERTILEQLAPLGFGAVLRESVPVDESLQASRQGPQSPDEGEAAVLKILLAINAVMFVAELAVGWMARSMGLVADSLDMFADAAVYGVSLYAVGRGVWAQKRAASSSGWLQVVLAVGALAEALRRAIFGSEPSPPLMMGMALVALVANATCLALLFKHRHGGVHMKASWIFSANDVIANAGVILAGAMVAIVGSAWPDLVVGALIGVVVLRGGVRILRLARKAAPVPTMVGNGASDEGA